MKLLLLFKWKNNMKIINTTVVLAATFTLPQIVHAQSANVTSNSVTIPGLYASIAVGVNVLDDIDFELDNGLEDTAETKNGLFSAISVGYSFPQGPVNFRMEGELSYRANDVDQLEDADDFDKDDVSALAGMLNAYVDYYIAPDVALTAGGGLGYAEVEADISVDAGAINLVIFDNEEDSGFAYQGRVGGRYDLSSNASLSLTYTYFAVDDLEIRSAGGDNTDFDYNSHSFGLGYMYQF